MSHFFETIKIQNGKALNLKYHNSRLNYTIKKIFGKDRDIDLMHHIKIPDNHTYRCKVIYSEKIEQVIFTKYKARTFNSFKIIQSDIEYPFKSTDRSQLDALYKKREDCDDIIIAKDGFIRDTSIANIVIYDGKNWITPSNPLLYGTTRERLLKNKIITEREIKVKYIKNIVRFALTNALIGFYRIDGVKIKGL